MGQVKAEIDVRFSKNYTNGSRTVTGVFTRDFREKVDECQILVTVPQCLGILLLSAEKHGWANRIKNVIFDELWT
ncbi:hypothetical protein T484DRAFT_1867672 [Baffinella frigidus]|nr:hypothetical protein T484DRAFT_1867672 [Cryptophyta sp. CCMP2293]